MSASTTTPKEGSSAPAQAVQLQPYVFFNGCAEEAIEFYRRALGAEVTMLMRHKDNPEPPPPGVLPSGSENKVMHAEIRIGGSSMLISDGRCQRDLKPEGFALSLTVRTATEADRLFGALSDGGHVQMPLSKTFFSECFGMAADRFGVLWMVYVAPSAV